MTTASGVRHPTTTPRVTATGLSKTYAGTTVLQDFSVVFQPGEVVGLVGANGAGKSTAGRMLVGALDSDTGDLLVDAEPLALGHRAAAIRRGLQYVPQELDLCLDLSVWENIAIADDELRRAGIMLPPGGARRRTSSLLARVGASHIKPYVRVRELSFSERQLVAIARALASDPHFIVFDEPTASLGQAESRVVQDVIRALADNGAACAFISHRTAEIIETCDRVVVLRDGKIVETLDTSKTDGDALEHAMFGAFTAVSEASRTTARLNEPSIAVDGATVIGEFRDVALTVRRGEVLGLYGLAGAGIGSLLRSVAGIAYLDGGSVTVRPHDGGQYETVNSVASARRAGLSFLSMDRKGEGIYPGHSTGLNIEAEKLTRRFWFHPAGVRAAAVAVGQASALGSALAIYDRAVDRLSGGQQQKAMFARRIAGGSSAWVMDEPFGGIDVNAKRDVTRIILERAARTDAVLISTGDITDLVAVCDRALVMRGGEIVGEVDAVEPDGSVNWTEKRVEALRAYAVR